MPVSPTYPGVYVEEIPSGVRTIVGVSTSTTAFVGRALKGPVRVVPALKDDQVPTLIHSFAEFERIFGGLWALSPMSFAVHQYFANGGATAVIVRVNGTPAATPAKWSAGGLGLIASSPGLWAKDLVLTLDHNSSDPATLFNLTVIDNSTSPATPLETIRNVSTDATSGSFVTKMLAQRSEYLRVDPSIPVPAAVANAAGVADSGPAADGGVVSNSSILGSPADRTGIYALLDTDIFNLLCLPPPAPGDDVTQATWQDAAQFCQEHRAVLLVDSPDDSPANVKTSGPLLMNVSAYKKNAALFYPRIQVSNPLSLTGVIDDYVPCGAVAGVFARTDAERGVWKAPAGIEAGLNVAGLTRSLTDADNGDLNPLGINCLRTFPLYGTVSWGSRTMDGADAMASEWKYVPVRRTALYLEESLYRGLKWVVFEPNAAPLWAQIRLNVGAFMQNLFRQGAFAGTTPQDAYFVKCDNTTTTQNDVNLGIVNILVGFAPLKPAEFVILKLQQMAGQILT
ncbi:MAG TPA: phage tail sheath C-terminal domain-containing protein [Thermoanaerobaculia bacterium]|jgi:phage tail sheath protein FI|nr:phage tail sheath C-terminal domain-containing protein [Thermoanaerobaculia bacterium]